MEIGIVGNTAGRASVTLHKVGLAVGVHHALFALLPTAEYHRSAPLTILLGRHGRQHTHVRPLRIAEAFLQRLIVEEVKHRSLFNETILVAVSIGGSVLSVII